MNHFKLNIINRIDSWLSGITLSCESRSFLFFFEADEGRSFSVLIFDDFRDFGVAVVVAAVVSVPMAVFGRAGLSVVVAKVVEAAAKIESAAESFFFSLSPTKLVKLIKPILQFFSSASSPGPGFLASLDT